MQICSDLNTNMETPKCRCIPQVSATQVLNTFYYLFTVKTSSWHNTKTLKPHCLWVGINSGPGTRGPRDLWAFNSFYTVLHNLYWVPLLVVFHSQSTFCPSWCFTRCLSTRNYKGLWKSECICRPLTHWAMRIPVYYFILLQKLWISNSRSNSKFKFLYYYVLFWYTGCVFTGTI